MAVDGFPQPAFDGLWPRQDFVLWVPDTLHIKNVQLFVLFSFTLATNDCLYDYEPTRHDTWHDTDSDSQRTNPSSINNQGSVKVICF
jgi:hypothetical protein